MKLYFLIFMMLLTTPQKPVSGFHWMYSDCIQQFISTVEGKDVFDLSSLWLISYAHWEARIRSLIRSKYRWEELHTSATWLIEFHAQVVISCNGLNTLLNSIHTIINQEIYWASHVWSLKLQFCCIGVFVVMLMFRVLALCHFFSAICNTMQ